MTSDATPKTTRERSSAMHIGEVAARTELSVRSLRHWEEVGLLRPSGRTDGGFRLYTDEDIDTILVIRRMKPLGFTLDEMKALIEDLDKLDDSSGEGRAARRRLALVQQDTAVRRAKLAQQLDMADEFIDILGQRLV